MAKDRFWSCDPLFYIRNCPKAFGTIPSTAYVLGARGARVHARIADLSMQTWVDSQSYTKYTPSRTSSLFVLVIQCIKYLTMMGWPVPGLYHTDGDHDKWQINLLDPSYKAFSFSQPCRVFCLFFCSTCEQKVWLVSYLSSNESGMNTNPLKKL